MVQFDSGTSNAITTRILVYGIMITCIIYDSIAFACGWRTITAVLRDTDYASGTLLRWLLLGVWMHLFVTWGAKGYGN